MIKKAIILLNVWTFITVLNCMDTIIDINNSDKKSSKHDLHLNLQQLNNNAKSSKKAVRTSAQFNDIAEVRDDLLRKSGELLKKGNKNNDTIIMMHDETVSRSTHSKDWEELRQSARNSSLADHEKWEILKKANPKIYEFAKFRNQSFAAAMVDLELLEEFEIEPEFLVRHIKKSNNLKNQEPDQYEIDHYRKLQETNRYEYDRIALDTIHKVCDAHEGKDVLATDRANTEHLKVQEEKIGNQEDKITELNKWLSLSKILHAVEGLVVIGISTWASYAEVQTHVSHSNNTIG